MTVFVALLRAVNVGGTGKLAMADLTRLCEAAGCAKVKTYIASGNVVFESTKTAARLGRSLEAALKAHTGKPIDVIMRTASEMSGILKANPFPNRAPNRTVAIFLDDVVPKDAAETVTGLAKEEIVFAKREIYVHYGDGMGRSKLKIAAAKRGTARNINTVAKLADMASELVGAAS